MTENAILETKSIFEEKFGVKVPLVRVIFPIVPDRNTLVLFYS